MQSTAHIIEFYRFKAFEAVHGRAPYRMLATFTKAHDAYLIAHDKDALEAAKAMRM